MAGELQIKHKFALSKSLNIITYVGEGILKLFTYTVSWFLFGNAIGPTCTEMEYEELPNYGFILRFPKDREIITKIT